MKKTLQLKQVLGTRAQAMVEFALVLMILMVVMVGILEVGRLIFFYAAVNNASREAVRYASAIGLDTDPDTGITAEKYQFCDMIKKMATRSAFFPSLAIVISYDHGPATGAFDTCDGSVDTGIAVNYGSDRVQVTVSTTYSPMVNLVPISSRTITSSSARTIFGYIDLDTTTSSSAYTPTSTVTTAAVITTAAPNTPTATSTATPTSTSPGVLITLTPLPSSTPTLIPSITPTATNSPTATLTFTPTGTSTPSSSCSTITAANISLTNNTNTISMTITNPYVDVTVSSISLAWNKNGALGNPTTLTLDRANLGTAFWSGLNNSSGTINLVPVSTLTLPGHNTKSTITFTFLQNYKASSMSGTTTITINLSTPGCTAIIKTAN